MQKRLAHVLVAVLSVAEMATRMSKMRDLRMRLCTNRVRSRMVGGGSRKSVERERLTVALREPPW